MANQSQGQSSPLSPPFFYPSFIPSWRSCSFQGYSSHWPTWAQSLLTDPMATPTIHHLFHPIICHNQPLSQLGIFLPWRRRKHVPPKRWHPPAELRSATRPQYECSTLWKHQVHIVLSYPILVEYFGQFVNYQGHANFRQDEWRMTVYCVGRRRGGRKEAVVTAYSQVLKCWASTW